MTLCDGCAHKLEVNGRKVCAAHAGYGAHSSCAWFEQKAGRVIRVVTLDDFMEEE